MLAKLGMTPDASRRAYGREHLVLRARAPDADGPFSYRATKDGRVRIAFRGRVVTTLAGSRAAAFLDRVGDAPPARVQLEMARATGNFKHGNERR